MAAPSTGLWPPVGGETSALIRARDWSASPLGLPHTWPPELKTAVGIMLGSPRPIAIYWGPEFICLYNDAYGGLLREKHPAALGRPLREVFPTAANLVASVFRRVMESGQAASEERRVLPLERGRVSLEAWFTFNAEPIFGPDGAVRGIFNAAPEAPQLTSERRSREAAEARREQLEHEIESQRQAARAHHEVDDYFRRIADATPALLWVTGVAGECTYLSPTWYEFTGFEPESGLGFGWLDAIHPDDREDTAARFRWSAERREPFQLAYRLRRHDGVYRWMIDSGRPRRDGNDGFAGFVGSVIDIDDRQRAEEALRQSEGRYAALFSAMDDGFCVVEVIFDGDQRPIDYRFVEVNPAFTLQSGIEDAEGRRMRELVPGLEQEWYDLYGEVALTGQSVRFEAEGAALGRWFEGNAFRVGDPRAHTIGIVFRDITQQKRDEEALQASAARDAFRVRLADVLRVSEDADSAQREATSLLAEHLGVDRVMWAEMPPHDVRGGRRAARDGRDAARSADHPINEYGNLPAADLMSGHTVVFNDISRDPRLGDREREVHRRQYAEASITAPVMRGGQLIAVLGVYQSTVRAWTAEEVAFVQEIAERTWTALERTLAERALRASEERFRRLADSMPQLVWTSSDDGTVEYYNTRGDAYDGLVHASEDSWEWRPILHPEDLPRTVAAWHQAIEEGTSYECEHRVRMVDGSYRWHLTRAERVEMDGIVQWYGTATDIHELMLADELKDQFLAIASHELRNPVSVIHGTAQQIRRSKLRGRLTEERFEAYLDSLIETSTHLASLTNDLTDVSRLQRGALPLNLEPMDLAQLVREVASREEWAERLHLEPAEESVQIEADRHRLRQVITNLIDNALKYSPADASVALRLLPDPEGARIEVEDQGIGVAPEDLEAIFRPFGRASNAGTVPGLGMGLFIAREIVERHGGDLQAISAGHGRGTTMVLWLPRTVSRRFGRDLQDLR